MSVSCSGRRVAAANGEYVGVAVPYGYDKAVIERRNTLVPNDKAQFVALIFEWYAGGASLAEITRRLNAMRVPTSSGAQWRSSTIRSMLLNPIYIGQIRWNGSLYSGLHEAIVPLDLFWAAQARLNS